MAHLHRVGAAWSVHLHYTIIKKTWYEDVLRDLWLLHTFSCRRRSGQYSKIRIEKQNMIFLHISHVLSSHLSDSNQYALVWYSCGYSLSYFLRRGAPKLELVWINFLGRFVSTACWNDASYENWP
jgi:hypothetical protein